MAGISSRKWHQELLPAPHVQCSPAPLPKNATAGFSAKTAFGDLDAIASHFDVSHDQDCTTRSRSVDVAQRAGANPHFDLALRHHDDCEICDRPFANLTNVAADTCGASDSRRVSGLIACWFDYQPTRQNQRRTHE